ncbi:MAG: hypothetical protein M1483_07210 [Actinobacteria bacterium]|nr:hypothetical protein [Actinomycetota bacterium]MCL6105398.1 hypothetical protein [Actinomycetota bacterium]
MTKEAPRSSLVCELYGLTLYRMGEWQEAIRVLERFERLTGSVDQYPVVADCWRASGDYQKVEEIWEVCRKVSEKEAMAECRIVVAAARADQGDMKGALSLMVPVCREIKHPSVYHLRQWYTLADLYERAGSIIQAKRWFLAVAKHDPELGCAQQRLNALR